MGINVNKNKSIKVFAIIVDINGYTKMVADPNANGVVEFTRDVLSGGIDAVEKFGGEVVGFMGDAFFGILEESEDVFKCCVAIAKDIDRICEYISNDSNAFPFSPRGPSIKIAIEYGQLDITDISCNFLGTQKIFAGEAINYADRISAAEEGNRCVIGPAAYEKGLKEYIGVDDGPYSVEGKSGEPLYSYYKLSLDDIWREGLSNESYWG